MNRIYSKVWNKSLGQLVVASELASRAGKAGGKVKGTARAAVAVVVLSVSLPFAGAAWAADNPVLGPNQGIFVNDGTDPGCTEYLDKNSNTVTDDLRGLTNSPTLCGSADKGTQTSRVLFYNSNAFATGGSTSLTLGDELFVNGGKLGLSDQSGTTYSMRIGSAATMGYLNNTSGPNGTYGSNGITPGLDSIAIGSAQTSATDFGAPTQATGNNAIAVGSAASVDSNGGIAIGNQATVTVPSAPSGSPNVVGASIAIGDSSQAGNSTANANAQSIAIGYQSQALSSNTVNGSSPVAVGTAANANGNGSQVAIGDTSTASGMNAVAIGGSAYAAASTTARGDQSLAIGPAAQTDASATGGVAIGESASVKSTGGDTNVALGANSTADGSSLSTAAYNPGAGTLAGTAPAGEVSVGKPGGERRLTHVAAGANPTDAVNVSQLTALDAEADKLGANTAGALGGGSSYSSTTGALSAPSYTINGNTYNNVGSALAAATTHYYSVNDGGTQGGNYNDNGATAKNALAAGVAASATSGNATAVGYKASASGGSASAFGDSAAAAGDGSVAFGEKASSVTQNSVAIGFNSAVLGTVNEGNVQAVAIGASSKSGVAAGAAAGSVGDGVAIGGGSNATTTGKSSPVAIGWDANASGAGSQVAIGDQALATGTNAVAIGGNPNVAGTKASGDYALAIGPATSATGDNTVSMGRNAAASATDAIAIGGNGTAGAKASANDTVAIGAQTTASAAGGVAIGNNASVSSTGSDTNVALGVNSTADGSTLANAAYNPGSATLAGTAPAGEVSVGKAGAERRITHVAAGANPTDAVNVSQLTSLTQATANALGTTVSASGAMQPPNYTVYGETATDVGTAITDLQTKAPVQYSSSGSPTTPSDPQTPSNDVTLVGSTAGSAVGLHNVAPGALSSTSTDAVNGSQLYATNQNVTNNATNIAALQDDALQWSPSLNGGSYDASHGSGSPQKIGNVADGVADNDAVNVSQLNAVSDVANKGWNVTTTASGTGTATGSGTTNVKPGDTVTYDAGNNIAITQNGETVSIATSMTPTFTSVTTGNSVLNSNGLTIAGGPSMTASGIDAGGHKVTNVASGTVAPGSTDAVNGGQLDTTNQTVATLGGSTANVLGGNASYDPVTGQVTDSNIGGTGENTVDGAISAINTAANAGWTASADAGTSQQIKPNGAVKFTSGGDGNLSVTQTGTTANQAQIQVQLAKNLDLGGTGSVTTGGTTVDNGGVTVDDGTNSTSYGSAGLTITDGPSVTASGIDAGNRKITHVADGTVAAGSTDAVNGGQLSAVSDVANKGWNVTTTASGTGTATGSGTTNVKPGDTVTYDAGNNIAITQNGETVSIATSMTPTFTSVTTGNSVLNSNGLTIAGGPSMTASGIDAGGHKVTNVASGTLAPGSTDAVNGGQLETTNQNVAAVDAKADALGNSTASNLGGGSTYNATTGAVSAPGYTMSNADGSTTTVNNVGDALASINSQGIKYFHANSTGTDSQALGTDSVAIGPNAVANNAGDVALGSGSTTSATTSVTGDTIGGTAYTYEGRNPDSAVSVGSAGHERQVQNVAAGRVTATSTDAVNGSQLYATDQAVNSLSSQVGNINNGSAGMFQVSPDANGTVPQATGTQSAAGGNGAVASGNQSTALGDNAQSTADNSVALGNGSVADRADSVSVGSVGNERQITNVAAGQVSATSTDAVNGSQLYAAGSSIATVLGGNASYDPVTGQVTDSNIGGTGENTVDDAIGAINTAANAGWTASADAGTSQQIKPNGAVKFTSGGDGNLSVTQTGTTANQAQIQVQLAKNLDLGGTGSVTTGATTVDNGGVTVDDGTNSTSYGSTGLTIANGPSVTTAGIDAGNRKITNVAPGTVAAGSTDAVNGDQLNTVDQKTDALGDSTASNLGGGSTYDPATGTVSAPSYTMSNADGSTTTVNNVGDALASINGQGIKYFHANSTGADSQALGTDSVAIGPQAMANGANAIAAGNRAHAAGDSAIAEGNNATANGDAAVATGSNATANGAAAVATGSNATANGDDAVAMGNNAKANGNAAIAAGSNASATGNGSVALGASATDNGNANATVLGAGASIAGNVGGSNVALGQGSQVASVAVATPGGTVNGTAYNYAGGAPVGVVSVGSSGNERQITNVAAGQVSATSTDAVNGSQLYATNSAIDTLAQSTSEADKGNVKYDKNADGTPNYGSVTLAGTPSTDGGATGGTTVTNVHQGALSSTSTDAVNGSQLYATNQQVSQNATDITDLQTTTTALGDSTASNLGGGSTYDPATGTVSAPGYTMNNADGSTTTVNNVGDALASINGQGIKYFHANSTGADSQALGTDSVAIGPGAVAGFMGDVALGAGSVTAAAVATASETLNGVTYAFAGSTPDSTVSVGSAGHERTVTNVAAGRISASSTDAVNGSQLYATNQAVSSLGSQVTSIGNGSGGMFQVSQDHNTPAPSATGQDSAAGGAGAVASGDASLAVGNGSTASSNQGTALGNGATASGAGGTAVGQGAVASADGSVALGSGSSDGGRGAESYVGKYSGAQNDTAGTVSVGNAATGETRTISNVADGTEATDAVNLRQLDGAVQAANDYTDTQISQVNGTVTGIQNGSAGMFQVSQDANGTAPQASGTQSVAGGNGAVASGSRSTAVGDDAKATAGNSVALGNGSVADRANSVSVGSAGHERQVTNVAAGTAATDAVNVSQLQDAQAGSVQYARNADGSVDYTNVTLNPNGSPATVHNVGAGTAATDAVNVGQLNDGLNKAMDWSKSYTDQRFQTLNNNLNTIGNRANAGIASAIAMASLPQAYQPDQNAASVALGNFHGETGIAIGVSKISESGRYVFKLNASDNTRGDAGVGVGAGIVW